MKKIILCFVVFIMCTLCSLVAFAAGDLVDEWYIDGNTITIRGNGENVNIFLLNPEKTVQDLKAATSRSSFAEVVNFVDIVNFGKSDSYSRQIQIKQPTEDASYLLYVKDANSEYTATATVTQNTDSGEPAVSLSVNEKSTFEAAENNYTSGTITLRNMPDKDGHVILAFYDENRLVVAQRLYEGNVSQKRTIPFQIAGAKSPKIKVFVLTEDLVPLCAADEVFLQNAPTIILKFDDARPSKKSQTQKLNNAINCLNERGIKGSIGVLTSTILEVQAEPANFTEQTAAYQSWIDNGHELWLHGYDHAETETDSGKVYEFCESYDAQLKGIQDSFDLMKTYLNYEFKTFGASWNTNNDDTISIINEHFPQIKTILFGKESKKATFNALNIPLDKESTYLSIESSTGTVRTFENFLEKFEPLKNEPLLVLQGHPPYWDETSIAEFEKILDHLEDLGCVFMTPDQYRQSKEQ